MKTIHKNLKPIDTDIHIKYECPECSAVHWLSLTETQTKGFVIVCDCDNILKPKRIDTVKIVYAKKAKTTPVPAATVKNNKEELLSKCIDVLDTYGFTKTESLDLLDKALKQNADADIGQLIKLCLSIFGEKCHG